MEPSLKILQSLLGLITELMMEEFTLLKQISKTKTQPLKKLLKLLF